MADRTNNNNETGNKPSDYYEGVNQLLFNMVPVDAQRILEVGCANGRLGQAIKKRNSTCHYVGIELFENAAMQARKVLDKVFISDVESFDWTKLSGERFDCIIFADVLEHLVRPADTIRAASAFLSQTGCLLCCLPNVSHWSIVKGLLRGEWEYADSGVLDRTHLRFFTLQTFKALLQECGFGVVRYARFFTNLDVDKSILPLLNTLQVDQEEFLERANTIQFLVKAERFPDNISILSKVEHQARVNERLPGPSVTIIACCNESAPITNEFIESIAKARTAFCAPMLLVADDATGETMSTDLNAKAQKHDWMQIVRFDNPIGISRSRNWAVGHTDCEYLVFLEGSTVVQAGWLEHLLEVIQDKKVGIVGSQLLYGDGTISQVGIAFTKDAHTQHLFRGYDQNDVRLRNPMEIPAITASCMLINRELFQQLQGFSLQYPDFLSELDLCFKVRQKGLTVVYHPGSKVVQSKLVEAANLHLSDQQQDIDREKFLGKWREMMQKDSLANPSFYSAGRGYQLIKP